MFSFSLPTSRVGGRQIVSGEPHQYYIDSFTGREPQAPPRLPSPAEGARAHRWHSASR